MGTKSDPTSRIINLPPDKHPLAPLDVAMSPAAAAAADAAPWGAAPAVSAVAAVAATVSPAVAAVVAVASRRFFGQMLLQTAVAAAQLLASCSSCSPLHM